MTLQMAVDGHKNAVTLSAPGSTVQQKQSPGLVCLNLCGKFSINDSLMFADSLLLYTTGLNHGVYDYSVSELRGFDKLLKESC